jgi:hypothetical protein
MPTLEDIQTDHMIYGPPPSGSVTKPNYDESYTNPIRESEYWRKLQLKPVFERAKRQLRELENLRPNWDSYGAEPPSARARNAAERILNLLESKSVCPTRIVPSSEGGVGICFVAGDRYADIECLNSGEILAVTYIGTEEPHVWEIEPQESEIKQAIEQIRAHITA